MSIKYCEKASKSYFNTDCPKQKKAATQEEDRPIQRVRTQANDVRREVLRIHLYLFGDHRSDAPIEPSRRTVDLLDWLETLLPRALGQRRRQLW